MVVRRGIERDTKIGLEWKGEVDLGDVEGGEYNQNTCREFSHNSF